MRLVIRQDYDEVSAWVAHYIKERINQFEPTKERPFVLGLPTGTSPIGCYRRLAEFCKAGQLSFKHVVTFNMDEYVGIPRNHKESYYSFMWTHLFQHLDIPSENIHMLDGNAPDLDAECCRYEALIIACGGIELFLSGIGPDGHIAFNEPGSSLTSRTRVKTLAYETIIANARFFDGDITKVPKLALTVGIATVMDAREVCMIITGAHKSIALAKCVEEGVNHMWTVSAVQMHPKGLIVCDEDATLELHVKTVKYFKSIEHVHQSLIGKENLGLQGELLSSRSKRLSVSSRGHDILLKRLLEDDDEKKKEKKISNVENSGGASPPKKQRRSTDETAA
ncbi:Glucosamine-6-phosphate isomerase 1 [Apophysomyces sp. BC1021]|nr:Glucosamine-6-phosphate isomerase 1 [Apophysomyces sp. BC1021]